MFVDFGNKKNSYFSVLVDDNGNIRTSRTICINIVRTNEFVLCPFEFVEYYKIYLKNHNIDFEVVDYDLVIYEDW